jgi:hypothetical protein
MFLGGSHDPVKEVVFYSNITGLLGQTVYLSVRIKVG